MEPEQSSSDLIHQQSWTAIDLGMVSDDISPVREGNGVSAATVDIFQISSREMKRKSPVSKKLSRKPSPWERFARTTTGHGFARMVDRDEPFHLKCFWAVVVILLTCLLFTSIFIISYENLVVKGLRREFIVEHNNSLQLPDIHICDTSLFNLTILQGTYHA